LAKALMPGGSLRGLLGAVARSILLGSSKTRSDQGPSLAHATGLLSSTAPAKTHPRISVSDFAQNGEGFLDFFTGVSGLRERGFQAGRSGLHGVRVFLEDPPQLSH
jgi:hypothetical protein